MNIWEIQKDILDIFNELEENGGELTDELAERLNISQENFRSKVEGYINVIKSVKADIDAIDQETKRLAELKKIKTNSVDRLNNVIINAIEMFGDTSKSGSKFLDYGTGKVSIRRSVKCETDDDKLKCIGEEYAKCIAFERMLGGASNRENITFEEMINRCKEHKNTSGEEVFDEPYNVTSEDLERSAFDITIRVGMEDMMCGEGYQALKNISSVFGKDLTIIPKIDKTSLKNYLANSGNTEISIGSLVENKNLVIK